MEYYSTIKKNKIMPFAAIWMDLVIIILSEVSQKEKEKWYDMIWYHLYIEFKIWHKKAYLWNKDRLTDIDNQLVVTKGEGE